MLTPSGTIANYYAEKAELGALKKIQENLGWKVVNFNQSYITK